MPERDDEKPSGIADAALKGARKGEQQDQKAEPDAKVNPNPPSPSFATENNEAPMGGAPVAFPAPSAQPTRPKPTEEPAVVKWSEEEDEDQDWHRAGSESPKK
jgi:hypothetical protein